MPVSGDILATYRAPRRVMARLLEGERHEARPLAYLLAALALMLVAQIPALRETARLHPDAPLAASLLARALALGVMLPVLYLVAAASHFAARSLGGRGDGFGARLALFWALLAAAPLVLVQAAVGAVVGQGTVLTVAALLVFAVFLWIWLSGLVETEFGGGR